MKNKYLIFTCLFFTVTLSAVAYDGSDKEQIIKDLKRTINGRIDQRLPAPEMLEDWVRDSVPDNKVEWGVNNCGQKGGHRPICGTFAASLPHGETFNCWIQVGVEGHPMSDKYLKVKKCFVSSPHHKEKIVQITDLPAIVK